LTLTSSLTDLQCDFDPRRPNEPCRDCKRRGFECGKTLPAQTNGRTSEDSSHSSGSPSPSDTSSLSDTVSDMVKVETPRSGLIDRNPASAMLQNLADFACEIQDTYPLWPTNRVLEKIRCSAEQGEFGDMHTLLYPSVGTIGVGPDTKEPGRPSSQFPTHPGYPTYITPMPCVPSVMPAPSRAYVGTVNPSTLTVMDHPFTSYTEELHRIGSPAGNVDSDGSQTSFPDPEFERPHYNYVSLLGLLPELMPQEQQDAYVVCHPPMTYAMEPRDGYYRGLDAWER
jgi:hypothetical protein